MSSEPLSDERLAELGLTREEAEKLIRINDSILSTALREARAEIDRLKREAPQYHERPTCPGLWLVIPDGTCTDFARRIIIIPLTAEDIERGVPCHASRVFGPIPQESETK